jgi:hypothetical protein
VERAGHENNPLVKFPPTAYRQTENCNGPEDAQMWWRPLTPVVRARYVIALNPIEDLEPADFPPVEYRQWLPLAKSRIYVEQVPDNEPPLTCAPGSADPLKN